jgi:hypothetical protein
MWIVKLFDDICCPTELLTFNKQIKQVEYHCESSLNQDYYADLTDMFWMEISKCENDYKINDNRKIIQELIKRKIPFTIQYNVYEISTLLMSILHYRTFIDYTVVVHDPKYAILCKLLWGDIAGKKAKDYTTFISPIPYYCKLINE